jgi:hypothetical protein
MLELTNDLFPAFKITSRRFSVLAGGTSHQAVADYEDEVFSRRIRGCVKE